MLFHSEVIWTWVSCMRTSISLSICSVYQWYSIQYDGRLLVIRTSARTVNRGIQALMITWRPERRSPLPFPVSASYGLSPSPKISNPSVIVFSLHGKHVFIKNLRFSVTDGTRPCTPTHLIESNNPPVKVTQGRTRLDLLEGTVQYETLRRAAI